MITGRDFCFLVVVIAGAGLVAVWYPQFFDPAHDFLSGNWKESVTAALVLVASVFLACMLCKKRSRSPFPTCCTDETNDSCKKKYAALPDPYPKSYEKQTSITKFQYKSDLFLLRLKQRLGYGDREEQYIVAKDYTVRYKLNGGAWQDVTVPRGTLTNLASSPRPARIFVGRVGPHLEASIVHDYLYIAWQVKGLKPTADRRRFADDLMLAAMKAAGMGCKAEIIYRAIRLFGGSIFLEEDSEPLILCSKQLPACCVPGAEGGENSADAPTCVDSS